MSLDPLLTSLCGVCHMRQPKYKCPRCSAKSCSLACVKKHKKWSSCNGERDPTVFIPAARLRTDSGIDHDYNFLTKIERKVEQVEKILTEEKHILPERDQGPPRKRARIHKGQSRGRTAPQEGLRPWARSALSRLRKLEVSVLHQPYGMSRERENATSYNRRTGNINWQVEWLILDPEDGGRRRMLHKLLEDTPLFVGFADCIEYHRVIGLSDEARSQEKREQKAIRRLEALDQQDSRCAQNPESSTWRSSYEIMQNPSKCRWDILSDRRREARKELLALKDKNLHSFYLYNPRQPSREAQTILPVEPGDTLELLLRGGEVTEFPSICVLSTGSKLPEGWVVEARLNKPPLKRKNDRLGVDYGSEDEEEEEEGEVHEGESDAESDPGFEFDDPDQQATYLEDGEVDDEDVTSSSGSDLDSDMDVY